MRWAPQCTGLIHSFSLSRVRGRDTVQRCKRDILCNTRVFRFYVTNFDKDSVPSGESDEDDEEEEEEDEAEESDVSESDSVEMDDGPALPEIPVAVGDPTAVSADVASSPPPGDAGRPSTNG